MSNHHNLLKESRLKVTPTRLAVLGIFTCDCKPVNAEDIFEKLKKKGINLVTIYRTLLSFEKAGILKQIDLHKGSAYYELAGHHHHHIVCTDCGDVESFDECGVKNLSSNLIKKSSKFKTIDQHSLEFFGQCKMCARNR
jgi:Fur family ferric uptake transcriptional regulator